MPVKDKVNSFEFNRKIFIQQNQPTPDAQGGETPNWVDIYNPWANFADRTLARGLGRRYEFMQIYPTATRIIAIRYQQSILIGVSTNGEDMRIRYHAHGIDHLYQILGAQNPSESNVSIWMACAEWQAKAVD